MPAAVRVLRPFGEGMRMRDLRLRVDLRHVEVLAPRQQVVDPLPDDVKTSVVWREKFWNTDEALSTDQAPPIADEMPTVEPEAATVIRSPIAKARPVSWPRVAVLTAVVLALTAEVYFAWTGQLQAWINHFTG